MIDEALVVLFLGLGAERRELFGAGPHHRWPGGEGRRDRDQGSRGGDDDGSGHDGAGGAPDHATSLGTRPVARASVTRWTNAFARRVISTNWPASTSFESARAPPSPTPMQPACSKGARFSR